MSHVEVSEGVRLFYQEYGSGDPVILVHGGSMTHRAWDHQVSALAEHFRTITYDFRGIGDSDRPPSGYSVEHLAHDLRDLIAALKLDKPAIVAYALGAHVALRLADIAPELIDKLVLVSAAPWFVGGGHSSGGFPPELWDRMRRQSAIDRAQADLDLIDSQYFHKPPSEGMRMWCAQMAMSWPLPVFQQFAQTLHEVNHEALLPRVAARVLVIHGRHDRKNRYEGGAYIAEHIPGARLLTFEESAHCPILEEVELFNTAVVDFLLDADGAVATSGRVA